MPGAARGQNMARGEVDFSPPNSPCCSEPRCQSYMGRSHNLSRLISPSVNGVTMSFITNFGCFAKDAHTPDFILLHIRPDRKMLLLWPLYR